MAATATIKDAAAPRKATRTPRASKPAGAKTKSAPEAAEAPKGEELRKKELIDAVVERSGVKRKDAKPAVEAALAILGEALSAGREMNLGAFGKTKINRSKDVPNGKLHVMRVRQTTSSGSSGQEALADTEE